MSEQAMNPKPEPQPDRQPMPRPYTAPQDSGPLPEPQDGCEPFPEYKEMTWSYRTSDHFAVGRPNHNGPVDEGSRPKEAKPLSEEHKAMQEEMKRINAEIDRFYDEANIERRSMEDSKWASKSPEQSSKLRQPIVASLPKKTGPKAPTDRSDHLKKKQGDNLPQQPDVASSSKLAESHSEEPKMDVKSVPEPQHSGAEPSPGVSGPTVMASESVPEPQQSSVEPPPKKAKPMSKEAIAAAEEVKRQNTEWIRQVELAGFGGSESLPDNDTMDLNMISDSLAVSASKYADPAKPFIPRPQPRDEPSPEEAVSQQTEEKKPIGEAGVRSEVAPMLAASYPTDSAVGSLQEPSPLQKPTDPDGVRRPSKHEQQRMPSAQMSRRVSEDHDSKWELSGRRHSSLRLASEDSNNIRVWVASLRE